MANRNGHAGADLAFGKACQEIREGIKTMRGILKRCTMNRTMNVVRRNEDSHCYERQAPACI